MIIKSPIPCCLAREPDTRIRALSQVWEGTPTYCYQCCRLLFECWTNVLVASNYQVPRVRTPKPFQWEENFSRRELKIFVRMDRPPNNYELANVTYTNGREMIGFSPTFPTSGLADKRVSTLRYDRR